MTVSNSLTYKIYGCYDSTQTGDYQSVAIDNKLRSLFNKLIPISNVSIDSYGNCSRLWSLSNKTFLATVCDISGNLHLINQNKIISPYSHKHISTILPKFKQLPNAKWDLHYNCINKELIVLPHLQAGAVDDIAVQSELTKTKKVNKNHFDEKTRSWIPPTILETPSKLGHIFRKESGHFHKDTPDNREYILGAVSDPANKVGENKFGREIYSKKMPDGYRAWAHVEKGFIVNGGRDVPWRKWEPNPEEHLGGRMVPIVTIFREQIQIDRLTNVFNTTIAENHWEPHPLETVAVARDVGGVRHETGIIVDLLEELQSSLYDDYIFFIPKTEGTSFLDKKEILQIVQEIAKGIYVHDTIPFFSLNMNPQQQNYSIIHPCYQNTYVGHVVSMLDYYLKGFWTGQLFDESFIQEWSKNPSIDDDTLEQHIVSMKELCDLHEETPFQSFDQILQELVEENSLTPEQLVILVKETENLVLSCKILGKQKSIPKEKNLFVLDGEVQLIHTVEWTPEGADQELCHKILDEACKRVCRQIEEIGFKIPMMQKWLSALQIMNFFSTYFRTLQQAEKMPVFNKPIQVDSRKICPSIFPPIPHLYGPQVGIEPKVIFNFLSDSQKELLQAYCQKDSEDSELKEIFRFIFRNAVNFPKKFSSEHMQPCIDAMLSAFRLGYRSIDQQVEKLLIDLKITSTSYHSSYKFLLNINIDLTSGNINQRISELKKRVASKRSYDEDSEILEALLEIKKGLDQASRWVNNPLATLVDKESWFYDIEQKKLLSAQKTSSGKRLKVYGGYEAKLTDMSSQESALAKSIARRNRKKLDSIEYEEIISLDSYEELVSIDSDENGSTPSGMIFKLPIEDSFPISSYGVPYSAIQLFSSSVANADDHTFYSLLQSIKEKDIDTFKALYTKGIDYSKLDLLGRAAIHYAAASPSTYFLQALIDKKVNLLTPDSQGWTAFHHAANVGNLAAIELILPAAPQIINTVANNGETSIYLAVHNNHLPVVEKLIQSNADLNLKPSHGYNLLLSAIHNGHEELALLLVQSKKIDLNYGWRNGKTALHFAIDMKMEKLLEALLRKGVDRNHPYLGKKPIAIAQEQDWKRGVEILSTNFAYYDPVCTIL